MQRALPFADYHSPTHRYDAPSPGDPLYYQGWNKSSISGFLQVSRPTVALWIRRFERNTWRVLRTKAAPPNPQRAGLAAPNDRGVSPAKASGCRRVSHLEPAGQRHHFRPHGGQVMATSRCMTIFLMCSAPSGRSPWASSLQSVAAAPILVYRWPHDGFMLWTASNGGALSCWTGTRAIVAGAMAPSEASWAALMVLYTACLRYGTPQTLISDSGGAYISKEVKRSVTAWRLTTRPL